MSDTDKDTIDTFEELSRVANDSPPGNVSQVLEKIQAISAQKFDEIECTAVFTKLLKDGGGDDTSKVTLCKTIAEITKNNKQRESFSNETIVAELLKILERNCDGKNLALTIQVCRALGNLCYENQKARLLISPKVGVLFNLLDVKNDGVPKETWTLFIKTRCGLISNYLVGSEEIAAQAVQMKLVQRIQEIMKGVVNSDTVEKNEDLLINILPPLSILNELTEITFDVPMVRLLVQILGKSDNPELGEMCLELLQCQAENDDVKYCLAKEGVADTLFDLLEKFKKSGAGDESRRALLKLACDLIVLILNGDDAMHYLYTTPFPGRIEKWLDSYDMDLLTTGVLAIGNFARTDSHCTDMVERGIMKTLIAILAKNNGTEDDMRLQHALLSALRNLVIPKPNKAAVVSDGLVETILPMLDIHQPPVVFKLLGTLRMTIDGQESLAMELLQNQKLIEQLIVWSKTIDYHAGVSAESLRLIAWLIKHAYKDKTSDGTKLDDKNLHKFIQIPDAVNSLVTMLSSSHVVMQNEALIALCILSVTCLRNASEGVQLDDILIESHIGDKISNFITRNADTMTKEIVENLRTLLAHLRHSEKLLSHLNEFNLDELIKAIPSLKEYCTL
ncbi:GTPase-GDP dissociation stimulator vimar [Culicoides brevitarsis]|uniref:GTPase-GDP dissociation stimulator vimar n=1 Tax=Culicoides brevitarsis TaxID=469753 RepID=UPI00307C290C